MYARGIKRGIDVCAAMLILVIGFIPMVLVSVLIKIDSPGPVLFKQKRIGKDGKVFTILKFRSMIDELPQAINILRGDMSFVGPRPPLTYHPWPINEYTPEQKRMFEVRPGITGWAQVHGRKDVEWHKRIEMNVWYVDHISFLLDLKIIFMTVFKVLSNADNENVKETVSK